MRRLLTITVFCLLSGEVNADWCFIRGDVTNDGVVDFSDLDFLAQYVFSAGPAPDCLDAADIDDDGEVLEFEDLCLLKGSLFGTGVIPSPNDCDLDPTPDTVPCAFSPTSFCTCPSQDYVLSLDSTTPDTVTLSLDSSAGGSIDGWSFGICNELQAPVVSVVDGVTTSIVNGGNPPDFQQVSLFPDGWAVDVTISSTGTAVLSPLATAELHVATYDLTGLIGSTDCVQVTACHQLLGSPPVDNAVVVCGGPINPIGFDDATVLLCGIPTQPDPDYIVSLQSVSDDTISVNLDSGAGADIQGWQFGICHTGPTSVTEVTNGSTTALVGGGFPPDLVSVEIFPEGWVVAVVIDRLGIEVLPPTGDAELHLATYDVSELSSPDDCASIVACDALSGSGVTVDNLVFVNGLPVTPTGLGGAATEVCGHPLPRYADQPPPTVQVVPEDDTPLCGRISESGLESNPTFHSPGSGDDPSDVGDPDIYGESLLAAGGIGLSLDGEMTGVGTCPVPEFAASVPIFLYNGEAHLPVVDLHVRSRGFNFLWMRTYSSRANFAGPHGHNWDSNYDRRLVTLANGDLILINGLGRSDIYTAAGSDTYTPPPGRFETLVRNPDDTFTQVLARGTVYQYDPTGHLVAKSDRAGNTMTFERNVHGNLYRVTDTQGRTYNLHYSDGTPPTFGDGSGQQKITAITDFTGRTVSYEYDGNDDLIQVRSPAVVGTSTGNDFPAGKVTLYTYSSGFADPRLNHNLLSVIEPLYNNNNDPESSTPCAKFTYAGDTSPTSSSFDRVVSEDWGSDMGGPPAAPARDVGGSTTLSYTTDLSGDGDAPPQATRKTTCIDRNGNVQRYYFAAHGRVIRLVRETNRNIRPGEADYVSSYTYTSDTLLASRQHPRGNRVTYSYDAEHPLRRSQGNLIESRQEAGTVSSDLDLVRRYTYEPVFNSLRTFTDERAFPTGVVPLTPSGKLDLAHPSVTRYTTVNVFDYQEGTGFQSLAGIPSEEAIEEGLGDLNGGADFNEGNIVQIRYPTITDGPDSGDQVTTTRTTNEFGQPLRSTDGEGEVTEYEYFAAGGLEGYLQRVTRDAAPGGLALTTEYDRDDRGNVVAVTDPKGQVTDIELNQLNQVVRVLSRPPNPATPSLRYRTDFVYNRNNDLVEIRRSNHDFDGSVHPHAEIVDRFEYDILHYRTASEFDRTRDDGSNPGTVRTEYFYDGNCNQIAVRSPEAVLGNQPDNVITLLYDERDLLYQVTRGDNDLDPANPPTVDAVVHVLNYDGNRNRIEEIDQQSDSISPGAPASQFPLSLTGDVTQYQFDAFDRVRSVIDAEGNQRETRYDPASNPTTITTHGPRDHLTFALDLLGETTVIYDELHRAYLIDELHFDTVLGTDIGDGHRVTTVSYDLDHRVEQVVDDRGLATALEYDGVDRVSRITDALSNSTQYIYDANGNVGTVVRDEVSGDLGSPADTFETEFVYDGLDRLTRTVDPGANIRDFHYDSRGNLVRTSDGVRGTGYPDGPGNIVRFLFDSLDRRVATVRELRDNGKGDGALIDTIENVQSWDDNSRQTSRIDDRGNETSYFYDSLNRLTAIQYADPSEIRLFGYDADGRLSQWTDQNRTVCTLTYDGLDRLTRRDVTPGPRVRGATFESFAYDGRSRAVRVENDNGFGPGTMVCTFEYDSLSNLTRDDQGGLDVISIFDGVGNRSACFYPGLVGGPGRRSLSLEYDALNRLQTIEDTASGPVTHYHYKGPSRVERRTYGPDSNPFSQMDMSYDAVPRVISMIHEAGGVAIAAHEYGYDREHHRTYERDLVGPDPGRVFRYDSLYRVVREDAEVAALGGVTAGASIDPEDFVGLSAQRWSYDGVGNRRTTRASGSLASLVTGSGPGGPRYTAARYSVQPTNEYTSVERDGVTQVLQHDHNGNLAKDGRRLFYYDFKNRLVEVTEPNSSVLARYAYDAIDRRCVKMTDRESTRYIYDGHQCVEERDQFGEVTRQYVWGPGTDELLEVQTPTGSYYAHENAMGSVVALTDESGATVESYTYDAFGNGRAQGSTIGNEYRFHTARFDPETRLYYMRARTYDPGLGRFLQRDPIGIWEDAVNIGNAYAFVGNQPTAFRDPTGNAAETLWDAANAAMGWASFGANLAAGNIGGAALDFVGAALDTAAVAVPFVPGGASTLIKIGRGTDRACDALKQADKTSDAARKLSKRHSRRKSYKEIKITKGQNRRHIVADALTKDIIENIIKSPNAARILAKAGYDPKKFGGCIKKAANKWRNDVSNKKKNLWPGDAAENQRLGRGIAAEKRSGRGINIMGPNAIDEPPGP